MYQKHISELIKIHLFYFNEYSISLFQYVVMLFDVPMYGNIYSTNFLLLIIYGISNIS